MKNKYYDVRISVYGTLQRDVEADNEEDALDKAYEYFIKHPEQLQSILWHSQREESNVTITELED